MSLSDAVICDTRRNEMEIYSFRNEKFVIREMQINNLQKEKRRTPAGKMDWSLHH